MSWNYTNYDNFLIIVTNFIFILLNHPLSMELMDITNNINFYIISNYSKSFLILLYFIFNFYSTTISFIYLCNITSFTSFSLSMKMLTYTMMMLTTLFLTSYIMMKYIFNLLTMTFFNSMMKENLLKLIKFYNYLNNMITLMLMNYLLMTLIAVVEISKLFKLMTLIAVVKITKLCKNY